MTHPRKTARRAPTVTIACHALANKKVEYVVEPDQPRRYLAISGAVVTPAGKDRREVAVINRGEPAGTTTVPVADADAMLGRLFKIKADQLPNPGEVAVVALR